MDDFAQFEDDNFDGNMAKSREFEFAIMDHALEYLGWLQLEPAHQQQAMPCQLRDDQKHYWFPNFPLYVKKLQR